ncbi:MAG: DUF2934 domain-containing protein [Solirubrobacterales bacterium]
MQEIPEELIRERAYHIWLREGCPDGRAEDHWQMARTELAIEMTPGAAKEPNPAKDGATAPRDEPVEPLLAVENQGSFPGVTDQDEEQQYPAPRKRTRRKT